MDEKELQAIHCSIAKIAAGDSRGIDEIYERIGGRMLSVAFGVLKNRALAEEALQDSFLKLATNADKFREKTNGYAWICKIVQNTALNKLKSENLRTGPDVDEFWSLSDGFEEVERTENVLLCEQALRALDEEERRIVSDKYFVGLTVREIAKARNTSKSTVQRIVDRAEEKMRKALRRESGGGDRGAFRPPKGGSREQ